MSSLMRWDPFRNLLRLDRELDRVFDRLFGRPALRWDTEEPGVRIPSVDLSETESEMVVRAELPGIDKDKIQIEVTPDSVSISGEMSEEREEKGETHHRRERVWGRFERTVPLPVEVVSDQTKATYRDGLLEVHLPKSERAKAATPKRVVIE